MKTKTIALVITAIVTATVVGWLTFTFVAPFEPEESKEPVSHFEETRSLHYYDQPSTALKNIRVDLVYFVPDELKNEIYGDWEELLGKAADRLKKFYELQFEGLAELEIQIYPEHVDGKKKTSFYDGASTDGGNPKGLRNIQSELRKRIYEPKGDLFLKTFGLNPQEFVVLGIIYEGVGASGSGDKRTFLLSREFLTRKNILYGFSFLAHEFGHTLGMPDLSYGEHSADGKNTFFTVDDIMGSGRFKRLELTYLSDEIKQHMITPSH